MVGQTFEVLLFLKGSMNVQREVVVIGGGVIGVCCAYYLASKGIQVKVIEKGEIASGCSYGNGGLIVPSHAVPLASPGALGSGLRWLLDAESPFYIKPRVDLEFFGWLIRFAFASRHSRVRRAIPVLRELPITMLVSTHDMRMVQELFPRTIVMDEGRIVADGRTKEILADEKFLNEHGLEKP